MIPIDNDCDDWTDFDPDADPPLAPHYDGERPLTERERQLIDEAYQRHVAAAPDNDCDDAADTAPDVDLDPELDTGEQHAVDLHQLQHGYPWNGDDCDDDENWRDYLPIWTGEAVSPDDTTTATTGDDCDDLAWQCCDGVPFAFTYQGNLHELDVPGRMLVSDCDGMSDDCDGADDAA